VEKILGVDVSKSKVHVALLRDESRLKSHTFENSTSGFQQLTKWLEKQDVEQVHACMESTGGYGETLALFLVDHGHKVSIVNPSRIKAFAGSELLRTKTDKVDAALIARFCHAHAPEPWTPPTKNERLLQSLVRRRTDLESMRAQEAQRLQAPTISEAMRSSLEEHVRFLDGQIEHIEARIRKLIKGDPNLRRRSDLLESITGLGETTAATILGEMPRIDEFRDAKAVAAYAGLSPSHFQSGTIRGRSRVSKVGNAHLRRSLFFPALVAMRWNPVLKPFAERLKKRGKRGKSVVVAVMRRLLVIACGVLKSGQPFTPKYAHA
jgi:transposase